MKFRRQSSIGNYIIDFYCPELKFGIELDGGEHFEEEYSKRDKIRTRELSKLGLQIIRFNNYEVLNNTEAVIDAIMEKLEERKLPSPLSSPRRGEDK